MLIASLKESRDQNKRKNCTVGTNLSIEPYFVNLRAVEVSVGWNETEIERGGSATETAFPSLSFSRSQRLFSLLESTSSFESTTKLKHEIIDEEEEEEEEIHKRHKKILRVRCKIEIENGGGEGKRGR